MDENGLVEQFRHSMSEVKEVISELSPDGAKDPQRVTEELLDLLHSVESCLWICEERLGVDIEEVRARVIKKNMDRGYYTV